MLAESLISLGAHLIATVYNKYKHKHKHRYIQADEDPAPPEQQVPKRFWITGLVASSLLCIVIASPLFKLPFYEPMGTGKSINTEYH
jgi:hypothetical protein